MMRLTADLDEEDFEDVIERLSMIYDVLVPPPKRSG
jgi:hypothetical protein